MIPWITWIVDAIDEGSLARQCVWKSVSRRSAARVPIELELFGHCRIAFHLRFDRNIINFHSTSTSLLCRCLKTGNWFFHPPNQMVSAWMNSNFASHHLFFRLRLRDFPQPPRILTITWERIFQISWIMDAEVTSSACQTHYSHRVLIWLFPASTIITIRCYAALNFAVPLISISQRMKWGKCCIFYTRSFGAHSRRSSASRVVVKLCWFANFNMRILKYKQEKHFASFSRNYLWLRRYPSSKTFFVYLPNDSAASRGKVNKFFKKKRGNIGDCCSDIAEWRVWNIHLFQTLINLVSTRNSCEKWSEKIN